MIKTKRQQEGLQYSKQPVCNHCKHYIEDTKCKAFDVIPDEILFGDNEHREPLKGQKNSITFKDERN